MINSKAKILYGLLSLSACLLAGVVLMLDRPPVFALNQAANHFYRKGDGLPQQLAFWLIKSGIASDWSNSQEGSILAGQYPLLRTAANSANTFPYQTYESEGQPSRLTKGNFRPPAGTRRVAVSSVTDISRAIRHAQPGDIITIAPGNYTFRGRSIPTQSTGTARLPIYVRAETFGTVLLNLDTLEGFHVMAPFWVFENLKIRGVCKNDGNCEHAFHVVGKGKSFTLRNSEIFNFNAHIKVNLQPVGGSDYYADYGLLEYNSFYNERRRKTGNPVTLLNIDAADGWIVRGNYIADFSKDGGDHTSYGAYMKGNSHSGIFEQNLVACEHRLPADQGIRVGLSFGNGGTGARYCKNRTCTIEHYGGIIRNNIIMNCSRDVGIYLNRAAKSQIYHNLLYNTLGIDVRFETSSASITNNIISGRIKNRDGGQSKASNNYIVRGCLGSARTNCELSKIYQAPDLGDFRLKNLDNQIWITIKPQAVEDFCGNPMPEAANPGPLQYQNGFDCLLPSSFAHPQSGQTREQKKVKYPTDTRRIQGAAK